MIAQNDARRVGKGVGLYKMYRLDPPKAGGKSAKREDRAHLRAALGLKTSEGGRTVKTPETEDFQGCRFMSVAGDREVLA